MSQLIEKIASPPATAVTDPLISPVGRLTPLRKTLTTKAVSDYSNLIFLTKLSTLALIGALLISFSFWFFSKRSHS